MPFERDKWNSCLPDFGRCAVTALVVQDLFGGRLVKDPDNDHYWNIFDGGDEYVRINDLIPEKLSREQKQIIEEMKVEGL